MRGIIKTVRKYGLTVYIPQIIDKATKAVMCEAVFMSEQAARTWIMSRI
jgi:hypothetical protein